MASTLKPIINLTLFATRSTLPLLLGLIVSFTHHFLLPVVVVFYWFNVFHTLGEASPPDCRCLKQVALLGIAVLSNKTFTSPQLFCAYYPYLADVSIFPFKRISSSLLRGRLLDATYPNCLVNVLILSLVTCSQACSTSRHSLAILKMESANQ